LLPFLTWQYSRPLAKFMKVTSTYKDIWNISYPIILGSLATTVLNLTDTAFIARVGEVALGSMAITTVLYGVMIMIAISIGIGAQIMMARRAGEGNHPEIGRLFDHTFLLLLGLAAICFFITYFFSGWFFSLILTSENIQKAAETYMIPRSFGLLAAITTIAFRSFYIGISDTRVITYSAFLMLLLNAFLDYALIFGHFGFPEMGLKGAAVASVISEFASLGFLVIYSKFRHEFEQYNLFRFVSMTRERLASILDLASPIILQNTLSMGAWFVFFVVIEHLGERELAISNIIRSAYMVLMTPMWGYASATSSMVSNIIGQNKSEEVKLLVKKIITLSLLTTSVLFIISFASPEWMLRIISSDEILIDDSKTSYFIVLSAMFIFAVSIILLSTVSGSGNTKPAMIIEIVNISIYIIYIYICVFEFNTSIEAVWFSEIIYWFLMGLLSYLYLKYTKWAPVKI